MVTISNDTMISKLVTKW